MDHSKKLKTFKTVLLLVLIVVIFLLVGAYYRNLFNQNSGNMPVQDVTVQQEQQGDTTPVTVIEEESGTYVNIRKADTGEEDTKQGTQQSSSLEFEVEENDYRNSTEWVHIIEFE